ncbi:MAG: hypothetical protein H6810_10960 [Phycisphaeraceae bacterium]|nr:MAG: hypothetical protein H6810_10960 [Phycisphaeraceae bacterium]
MTTIDLAGRWFARPDRADVGIDEGWASAEPGAGWVEAELPGAWQHVFPDGGATNVNRGVNGGVDRVWYRRCVPIDSELRRSIAAGRTLWFLCEGAATDTTVFANGIEVGRWVGDWVPFQLDLTEKLEEGAEAIDLALRIDRIRVGPVKTVNGHPQQDGHITKGFHDVLSIQKAGVWCALRLETSGPIRLAPQGVTAQGDPATGAVRIGAFFDRARAGGELRVSIVGPDGNEVARGRAAIEARPIDPDEDDVGVAVDLVVDDPAPWTPESPMLYVVHAEVVTDDGAVSDVGGCRLGFRSMRPGGPENRNLLLNGEPIHLSFVLDWGHDPRHIAPFRPREEIRAVFSGLRERGFNGVCLCMYVPPEHYFEVADETGMMLWQEHPIWKSDMRDERLPEYRRQLRRCFRRSARHPSVVVLSGSCEHEEFNPKLAAWWWEEAEKRVPLVTRQIQTAFLTWTDNTKTEMYDEHTYECSGRWVDYLAAVEQAVGGMEPRPFAMGESVLYVNWPRPREQMARMEREGILGADGRGPWWRLFSLDAAAAFEDGLEARFGAPALEKFQRDADRFTRRGRKFQTEAARGMPRLAAVVQNHINDVPAVACGFIDDFGEHRFEPSEARHWLARSVCLLRTPEDPFGHRACVRAGSRVTLMPGLSNHGSEPAGPLHVTAEAEHQVFAEVDLGLTAAPGEVVFGELSFETPGVDAPTRLHVRATAAGAEANAWELWLLPETQEIMRDRAGSVSRLDARPFDENETSLDFEEKKYSSGWGLPNDNWRPRQPDPAMLLPDAVVYDARSGPPTGPVVTHRLTPELVERLEDGARVVLLPSKAAGSCPVAHVNLWGQSPLVRAAGPLARHGSDWVLDALDLDLNRSWIRAVPVGELGLVDAFEPFVRLCGTHDSSGPVKLLDQLSATRVGEGVLLLCSLDLFEPAGQLLLAEVLGWLKKGRPMLEARARVDPEIVRGWVGE